MAIRSKKKKRARVKKSSESLNQIRHLETLLKFSLRAANGMSPELDALFDGQADRIREQIKKVKENQ
jgi:gas vesicle protein